jgi:hypothetical protein
MTKPTPRLGVFFICYAVWMCKTCTGTLLLAVLLLVISGVISFFLLH